jgi:hypothetical protein
MTGEFRLLGHSRPQCTCPWILFQIHHHLPPVSRGRVSLSAVSVLSEVPLSTVSSVDSDVSVLLVSDDNPESGVPVSADCAMVIGSKLLCPCPLYMDTLDTPSDVSGTTKTTCSTQVSVHSIRQGAQSLHASQLSASRHSSHASQSSLLTSMSDARSSPTKTAVSHTLVMGWPDAVTVSPIPTFAGSISRSRTSQFCASCVDVVEQPSSIVRQNIRMNLEVTRK